MAINLGDLFIDGESVIEDENGNHTITNYSVTINTENKKFGDSSLYFGSGSGILQTPYSDDFSLTGDFTIDFWVNFTNQQVYSTVISNAVDTNASGGFWIEVGTSRGFTMFWDGAAIVPAITTGFNNLDGQGWQHIAVVRSSGSLSVYLNGTSVYNNPSETRQFTSTSPLNVGNISYDVSHPDCFVGGYLDNIRIVNGEALWASDFNLTAIDLFYAEAEADPNPNRPENIRSLYDISSVKGNLRGRAKAGFIRPTLKQFFTSENFEEIVS